VCLCRTCASVCVCVCVCVTAGEARKGAGCPNVCVWGGVGWGGGGQYGLAFACVSVRM
jgi:hypothetical protein